jgi:DNA-binding NarL/FixJ family response regulator
MKTSPSAQPASIPRHVTDRSLGDEFESGAKLRLLHTDDLLKQARDLRQMASSLERLAHHPHEPERLSIVASPPWTGLILWNWDDTLAAARSVVADPGAGVLESGSAHTTLAVGAALQGDDDAVRRESMSVARSREVTECCGTGLAAARALSWLAAGVADVAFEALNTLVESELQAGHEIEATALLGYLAEAAVRAGRGAGATRLVDRVGKAYSNDSAAEVRSEIALAKALLAEDSSFEQAVGELLQRAAAARELPHGRLELALGMWLRRRRRISEARPHLQSAYESFEMLGHQPWMDVALRERRAAGDVIEGASRGGMLSPQELQIAVLAAEGLSNREIGAQLYLSPRTVGSHLYRIFPKLNICSRAQIARKLDEVGRR